MQPKVLISIPTCHKADYTFYNDQNLVLSEQKPMVKGRVEAIRRTWFKDVPEHVTARLFYGRGPARDPLPDEVFLDVADNYEALPHKVKAIFRWALDNDYEYVFKVDDDTVVNVERLLASGYEYHDWSGRPNGHWLSGGSGYWVSRRAMEFLVEANIHPTQWAEDAWVGRILRSHGIEPYTDERYVVSPYANDYTYAIPQDWISLCQCEPQRLKEIYQEMKKQCNEEKKTA